MRRITKKNVVYIMQKAARVIAKREYLVQLDVERCDINLVIMARMDEFGANLQI